MSKPMTATQVVTQTKKWGINAKPYKKDWASHNRGMRGNGWGITGTNRHGVVGVMLHHVGVDGNPKADLYQGSIELPGPKCQFSIDVDGQVWLIGWGRANHAGGGDPAVLAHVIAEDYGQKVLVPKFGEGDKGAVDGNGYFYGIEIEYSGKHTMTPKQYQSALRLCAAINDFHKWTELSDITHGEWSHYKWDPGMGGPSKRYNPVTIRKDIKAIQQAGPTKVTIPPQKTTPPPVKTVPPVAKPAITLSTINNKLDLILKKLGG